MSEHDYISEMNAYYEAIAELHDIYMNFVSNKEMEKLLGALIRLIEKDVEGKNVLEIACGTGNWTTVLAKRARYVTAVDASESMLKIARKKLSDIENVTLFRSDVYRLPNMAYDYDCAFSSDFWSHIPRGLVGGFLENLHSKLSGGATVIFIDMLPQPDPPNVTSRYDDCGNYVQRRILPDGRVFDVVKNFPEESELRELLTDTAVDIRYYRHLYLLRWVLKYRIAA
ncbi:MAG: class I SAM-dependent methyltransferase [candidate division Zixibacteria bacterium]|nr:class I SAM-dependent methyltransferase [candidate division Zixibacteria bacterium]NIR66699.1 class I SAM-dependent methyltransferase [candidate division Zixibacteria bacterium]NIS14883.1 class I SAM-dependent methyltransferase [candidate division Zixibacteria bacterium]NIS48238.1 class I SAM-dependent methyltransferase [candidate division Zixibacteria bacterium]NIT51402.1 class I SAM-dependent methyltransferase [candidate division Zixibacteria bacterium]